MNAGATHTWLNGQAADGAMTRSRAFQYGDGVFRTLLRQHETILDLDAQLARLIEDAARLGIVADGEAIRDDLSKVSPDESDLPSFAVVKIVLVRPSHGRGYAPTRGAEPAERWITVSAAPRYPRENWTAGIRVGRASIRLAAQPALAGIKHLNRLEQVLAYRDADPAWDEVLCADADDRPVCGGRSNLFCIGRDTEGRERLLTPDLRHCGIRGVMRDKVLVCAAHLGLAHEIADLSWDRLNAASEVFVTNSLIGIWPVRAFGAYQWVAPGLRTRQLMLALGHPQLSADP